MLAKTLHSCKLHADVSSWFRQCKLFQLFKLL
jgi:hypothetical protein